MTLGDLIKKLDEIRQNYGEHLEVKLRGSRDFIVEVSHGDGAIGPHLQIK